MRRGRLPVLDRVAQGLQECSLLGRIAVGVLGQQPRRLGAVLTDHRPPRPAPGVQNLPEPPRVVLVDALPLRRQLVREPERVLPRGRGHRGADPLILITSGQQFLPQFFIHAAISRRPGPAAEDRTHDQSAATASAVASPLRTAPSM
jgi:hypothetical protein